MLDRQARPDFQLLQRRLHVSRPAASLRTRLPATLFVFDVLHLDDHDVTQLPHRERRELLSALDLDACGDGAVVTSPSWGNVEGDAVVEAVRQLGLEGVVAKVAESPYQPGRRSRHWIKTPFRNTGFFLVGGFIPQSAHSDTIGSLLVGAFDPAGDFCYCGHVTVGFSHRGRRELHARLSALACVDSPFRSMHPAAHARVQWVKPVLVGRIEYREFTGRLRHAAWKGIEAIEPTRAQLPPLR